jgi:hypothetical protein
MGLSILVAHVILGECVDIEIKRWIDYVSLAVDGGRRICNSYPRSSSLPAI